MSKLSKDILRKKCLDERYSWVENNPSLYQKYCLQVIDILATYLKDLPKSTISFYWPIKQEIDIRNLLEKKFLTQHTWCLPVLDTKEKRHLNFASYSLNDLMEEGDFGVFIPLQKTWVKPDILLVPLVAFNSQGYRLGLGGGFYDYTIATLRQKKPCIVLGVGFDFQENDFIQEEFDAKLDGVATQEFLKFF